ncbi:MAG: hypothetical protein K2J81_03910 [Treponemataceae bacterium]|nr:hypothetical protein [Treponemataceae bacterium]
MEWHLDNVEWVRTAEKRHCFGQKRRSVLARAAFLSYTERTVGARVRSRPVRK